MLKTKINNYTLLPLIKYSLLIVFLILDSKIIHSAFEVTMLKKFENVI